MPEPYRNPRMRLDGIQIGTKVYVRGEGGGTVQRVEGDRLWVRLNSGDLIWMPNDRNFVYIVSDRLG
jgi:hypothetical protein